MPDSMTVLEQQFSALIEARAVAFGDLLTLHADGDVIFIVDPESHELLHIASNNPEQMKAFGPDWKGQKCYACLQGRDEPCTFCNNHLLRRDSYHVSRQRNPVTGKEYILKDKLVAWQGKELRMEKALDASDQDRNTNVLFESISGENQMITCMRILTGPEPVDLTLRELLISLCRYFDASSGFVTLYHETGMTVIWSRDGRYRGPVVVARPTDAAIEAWGKLFETRSQLLLPNIASLDDAPDLREAWRRNGIASSSTVPIRMDGKLIGMIGLNNIGMRLTEISMLEMLEEPIIHKLRAAQLQRQALRIQYADPLTGGLNLEGFRKTVEESLLRYPERKFSIWYCDIKNFKFINDAFGYDTGDRLLQYWAALFSSSQREGDAFCRVTGDNFAGLYAYDSVEELTALFRRGIRQLHSYPELQRKHFRAEVTAGVYLIETLEDRLPLNAMMDRANIVQKRIKNLPGSNISFYTDDMRAEALQEITLLADAEEGLRMGEFVPYFQRQVSIRPDADNTVLAEVLVRWKSERYGGLVPPNAFIPLFERSGLIVELDHAVFQSACAFLHEMMESANLPIRLSVNVSRTTALQPDFVAQYTRIRDAYAIPADCLELEFTESLAVENMARFAETVDALRAAGFLCAMDDFGVGFSSLTALHQLPLHTLKLDRQFFRSVCEDARTQTLVSHIIGMATDLNMETVAEGIETMEQVELLRSFGCAVIQGYVFARPVPPEEFRAEILGIRRNV